MANIFKTIAVQQGLTQSDIMSLPPIKTADLIGIHFFIHRIERTRWVNSGTGEAGEQYVLAISTGDQPGEPTYHYKANSGLLSANIDAWRGAFGDADMSCDQTNAKLQEMGALGCLLTSVPSAKGNDYVMPYFDD